ncbi:MAG: four helix bundle protein [Polyangiaceae bacterium]|nr:four helix bundle protein [Polyangiaceae bacterium]
MSAGREGFVTAPAPFQGMTHRPNHKAPPYTQFPHHGLDAYAVGLEALTKADALAKKLPRGYGPLSDQLRRASQSAFLQLSEGAARTSADRAQRLRGARAEACEACVEALERLGLATAADAGELLSLLGRLAAMLTEARRPLIIETAQRRAPPRGRTTSGTLTSRWARSRSSRTSTSWVLCFRPFQRTPEGQSGGTQRSSKWADPKTGTPIVERPREAVSREQDVSRAAASDRTGNHGYGRAPRRPRASVR